MRHAFALTELVILIAVLALIAAVAIPNLLERRAAADESAAARSLKSVVFPAEVEFQAGGYEDLDENKIGEYGTIEALAGLCGTRKTPAGKVRLIHGALAAGPAGRPMRAGDGYAFTSLISTSTVIATGANAATTTEGTDLATLPSLAGSTTNDERLGERYFIVGCCPAMWGRTGRRVFFITQQGEVCNPMAAALVVKWYGGADPSTDAGARAASAANLQAGLVAALTGTAAAPSTNPDVTGASYAPAGQFLTDSTVIAK